MKRRNRGWLGILLGLAAVIVILRRKLQPIDSAPLLPSPPPPSPEPPRIVLPTELVNGGETAPDNIPLKINTESDIVAEQPAPEQEMELEAPLLEREVGGSVAPVEQPAEQPAEPSPASAEQEDDDDEFEIERPISYCVSCRQKQPMNDAHEEMLENGRRSLRGTCSVCGTKMVRFLKNK